MVRAIYIGAAVLLVVVAGAAYLLLSPAKPAAAREVRMSGAEFAREYSQYRVDPPTLPAGKEYYNFPSLRAGDTLIVRDKVTRLDYSSRMNATAVALRGFEGSAAIVDGLLFAGNLTKKYAVGDPVEITFHVKRTVRYDEYGTQLYDAELLDELNGKARERSLDGIPASAIRKAV